MSLIPLAGPDHSALDAAVAEYEAAVAAQVAATAEAMAALTAAAVVAGARIAELRAQLAAALNPPPPAPELIELLDFSKSVGRVLPAAGYTGKGIGKTIITMRPFSSTQSPPTAKGTTNPLRLLRTASGTGGRFGGFTLQGTPQGKPTQHMYGGLMIAGQKGATVSDVLIRAIPGNAGGPPGETFGASDFKCTGITWTRVEVDGRDASGTMTKPPDGSSRVGASGLAANSSVDVEWDDCYIHDHYYGMPTAWDTVGFITRNLRSIGNWRGINHERVTGVVEHHNPTLVLAPGDSGRNALHHLSFNNDIADCPTISVFAPVWSGGHPAAGGALCVSIAANYAGGKQKQTSVPKFFNADGTPMFVAHASVAANAAMGVAARPAAGMAQALADPKHSVVVFG